MRLGLAARRLSVLKQLIIFPLIIYFLQKAICIECKLLFALYGFYIFTRSGKKMALSQSAIFIVTHCGKAGCSSVYSAALKPTYNIILTGFVIDKIAFFV